jgi:hypothetical protein
MKYKVVQLGTLEVVEVYDYYDGPKFFTVRDVTGRFYVVYWCDIENEAEGWLYLPISEHRLDDLRRKNISAHEAFSEPEIGYWLVYTRVKPRAEESIQFYNTETVNHDFFPPEGMFVEHIDVVEKGGANWNHELYIERDSLTTTPSAEVAAEIFTLWTTLIESTMNLISKSQSTHITSALPGSLEVKVGSSNVDVTYEALSLIDRVVSEHQNDVNLVEQLYSAGIEPYKLRALFEAVRRNKLKISITPRALGVLDKSIVFTHENSEIWIRRLEPLISKILGTDKIPQADEISKIIDIVNFKKDGIEITPELLGVTERQVRYYEDAAISLGVLDKNRDLSSIGYFIGSQNSDDEKYSALAIRFESSDCGWSWIKWSGVNSLVDLVEDTAESFLIDVAPGLSENTAKRRASTLRLWLRKLKPHHYKYVGQ